MSAEGATLLQSLCGDEIRFKAMPTGAVVTQCRLSVVNFMRHLKGCLGVRPTFKPIALRMCEGSCSQLEPRMEHKAWPPRRTAFTRHLSRGRLPRGPACRPRSRFLIKTTHAPRCLFLWRTLPNTVTKAPRKHPRLLSNPPPSRVIKAPTLQEVPRSLVPVSSSHPQLEAQALRIQPPHFPDPELLSF